MANFNIKGFFATLLELAPEIVGGIFTLKNEAGTASKVQEATDSLTLATGIAEALTSSDPDEQQDAATASAVVQNVISTVATATAAPASPLPAAAQVAPVQTVEATPAVVTRAIVQAALATPPPA
jgi:hypothetical protein